MTLPRFDVHQIADNFLMNGGQNGHERFGSESRERRGRCPLTRESDVLTASKSMRYGHAFVPRALALESALLTLRPSVLILKGLLNVPAATSEKRAPSPSNPSPSNPPSNPLQTPFKRPLQHFPFNIPLNVKFCPKKILGQARLKPRRQRRGRAGRYLCDRGLHPRLIQRPPLRGSRAAHGRSARENGQAPDSRTASARELPRHDPRVPLTLHPGLIQRPPLWSSRVAGDGIASAKQTARQARGAQGGRSTAPRLCQGGRFQTLETACPYQRDRAEYQAESRRYCRAL